MVETTPSEDKGAPPPQKQPLLPQCIVKEPSSCTGAELSGFVDFVVAGGEVAPGGLLGRVKRAGLLSFLRLDGQLIGVAGLKKPSANHRTEVSVGSGVELTTPDFGLELGWVFVAAEARGGMSILLCRPLIAAAETEGIFATSRTNNLAMHSTLSKLGFVRMGCEWPSALGADTLCLLVKSAPKQS